MEESPGAVRAAAPGARAPRPFLRRGEGVEKRVFASRYRKPLTAKAGSGATGSGGASEPGTLDDVACERGDQHSAPTGQPAVGMRSSGNPNNLARDTRSSHPLDHVAAAAATSSRFLRNSEKAAWEVQHAAEELELEEFRALELQIKADVVGGSKQRNEQAQRPALQQAAQNPQAMPLGGSLGRSYASIHQRPVLPISVRQSTSGDRPAARVDMEEGWGSEAQQGPPSGGFGRFEEAEADGDLNGESLFVEAPGSTAFGFGQQLQADPTRQGPDSGFQSWDGASSGLRRYGRSPARQGPAKVSAFDDSEAWNDASSFFGSGCRTSSTAAGSKAGSGAQGKPRGAAGVAGGAHRGSAGMSRGAAELDDPWASAAGHGGTHEDAFGAESDREAAEPQQPAAGAPEGQGDRGFDQPFVRALFNKQRQGQQATAARAAGKASSGSGGAGRAEPSVPSAIESERLQALEKQLAAVAAERSTLVRMRTELEKAASRLEQEQLAWEKAKAEEQARLAAERETAEAKLRRDRRVLDKQSKALLKLPNKKERSAMEVAEAALEAERREGRAREARHKLTVERLRRQLLELQERNQELREEVRWHEAQQLERGWPQQGAGARQGPAAQQAKPRPSRTVSTQTDAVPCLPPLDAGAAPAGLGPSAALAGGRLRGGNTGGAAALGARLKSSGFALPSGCRVQAVQDGRPAVTPGPPQHAQGMRWNGRAGQALNRVASSNTTTGQQWQESYEEQLEGEGDLQDDTAFGTRLSQEHELTHTRASVTWREYAEQTDDGEGEATEGGEDAHEPQRRSAGAGQSGANGGAFAATAVDAPPCAHGYMQDDDNEVLSDDVAGGDGDPSTLAWRQHQDFMARMGLTHDDLRTRPDCGTSRQDHNLQQRRQRRPGTLDRDGQNPPYASTSQQSPALQQAAQQPRQQVSSDAGPRLAPGKPGAGAPGAADGMSGAGSRQQQAHAEVGSTSTSGRVAQPTAHPHQGTQRGAPSGDRCTASAFLGARSQESTADGAAAAAVPFGRGATVLGMPSSRTSAPASAWASGSTGDWQRPGGCGPGPGLGLPYNARQAWVSHQGEDLTAVAPQQQQQHGPWSGREAMRPPPQQYKDSIRDDSSPDTGAEGPGAGRGPASAIAGTTFGAAAVAHTAAAEHFRGGPGRNGVGMQTMAASHRHRADVLLRETRNADGKVERTYASGRRLVLFANGTRKVALPDGSSRVYFENGDIKWTVPASAAATSQHGDSDRAAPGTGAVHYYYAEVGTWHSSYGGEGGVEVFYFPDGQVEAHHPGWGKEIVYPDGVLRVLTADGEMDVSRDMLSWAIQQPQPQVEGLGDDDL